MKFNAMFVVASLTAKRASAFVTRSSPLQKAMSPSFIASTRSPRKRQLSMNVLDEETMTIPPPAEISEEQVRSLFYLWNDALATGDARLVARRYAPDAVLLPTVSDEPRTDYEGIKSYFEDFLKLKPQGEIIDGNIKIGPGFAKDSGIYEFTMGKDSSKVKARYSFIYTFDEKSHQWKILHHHSSVMPESVVEETKQIGEEQVRNLFLLWNDALGTLDADAVANRYATNAVLLPTVSDEPRTDYEGIKDYFENFLLLKPQGTILESHVQTGPNWAKDVGVYEFEMGADGSKVKARYSFVYTYEDGAWKIAHHHSSAMPESTAGEKITEDEVKDLFNRWNKALGSLNSTAVADLYSKNAVLLPTVSDIPRTNYALIKDYFDNFLQLQPQGEILESNVEIGNNWAQDAGIYEFTMGATGKKVKGRYSFVYTFEDGSWKIIHHHSSVMPESIISAEPITEEQVCGLFDRWNSALATLDSSKVAACYSKNAVLLPTVSDVPRTDEAAIIDYFDTFLTRKPQGVIKSGDILIGANWALDAGVYEFTMGDTGEKVMARYSFIYVFEDGEWKISHHHSSVMPEGLLALAEEAKKETLA